MAKADLHVHSRFSEHPSEWFLQRLGASESYTEPETILQDALSLGMDFVTITDHNCIDGTLLLKEKYPEIVIPGVESTAYFPEDQCKIHILIYGLDETQFREIDRLRTNIYELRDYLLEQNLAHSVAHATYAVNNRISVEHLEKLILLFDVFEGRNGARSPHHNKHWTELLEDLTQADIETLYQKHGIRPASDDPWIKGFTGGSDDHAGLFIGKTFTECAGKTPEEFIENLKKKKSVSGGRHNDFQSLAFAIYKIAYDFSKRKAKTFTRSFFSDLNGFIFDNREMHWKNKWLLNGLKKKKTKDIQHFKKILAELVDSIRNEKNRDVEKKLGIVYDNVGKIADVFTRGFIHSVQKDIKKGDLVSLLKSVSMALPGIFLSLPFLTTFKHLSQNRKLMPELKKGLGKKDSKENKRILWFTDTLTDLNGVSVTLRKIGWTAHRMKKDMKLLTVLLDGEKFEQLPPNLILIDSVYDFKLPYYDKLRIKIPSLLQALKAVYDYNPDEIVISTPGPVGLLGLLAAKLLDVPCAGIYHTDFTMQAHMIIKDESVVRLVENYTKWFFEMTDEIRVPTHEYISILEKRGFDLSRMTLFRRGIAPGRRTCAGEGNDTQWLSRSTVASC